MTQVAQPFYCCAHVFMSRLQPYYHRIMLSKPLIRPSIRNEGSPCSPSHFGCCSTDLHTKQGEEPGKRVAVNPSMWPSQIWADDSRVRQTPKAFFFRSRLENHNDRLPARGWYELTITVCTLSSFPFPSFLASFQETSDFYYARKTSSLLWVWLATF